MVMTAALVSVFFGMLALSVDIGFGLAQRRASQNAADAAAFAAAKFLAGQVSVDASGNVVFIESNDGLLWNAASPFFTANRIGGPLTPTFRTALQYLDCSSPRVSLGYSSGSDSTLITALGGGTKLASTAQVPGATCAIRTTSQVQFGSFFGRATGKSTLTANAQATARIAPTPIPSGYGTWPITRWLNGGAANCPYDVNNPCIFWGNNGVPGNTSLGNYKEALDMSRYMPSDYSSGGTLALDQFFPSTTHWDDTNPPASVGSNDKTNDLPYWLLHGWNGLMPGTTGAGSETLTQSVPMVVFGGDLGNNASQNMIDYINAHSQGIDPNHTTWGAYATIRVFLWDQGQVWSGTKNLGLWVPWVPTYIGCPASTPPWPCNKPDRVILSKTRCFNFYATLVDTSSIKGYYTSCRDLTGTPGAGPPSKDANTIQTVGG
jgi:hypothetical protein